jgi:two-component system, OmpR family, phosphate regulon sensor histidine kinase PhoR
MLIYFFRKMNTRFRVLILLMVVTMVGLISFQWYWIENAFAEKKQQFDRNVADALQETVRKIEKQEIIYVTQQKIRENEQKRLLAIAQKKYLKKTTRPKKIKVDSSKTSPTTDQTLAQRASQNVMLPDGRNLPILIPEENLARIREIVYQQDKIWENLMQSSDNFWVRQQQVDNLFEAINNQLVWEYEKEEPIAGYNKEVTQNNVSSEKIVEEIQEKKHEKEWQKSQNKANLLKDVFADFIHGQRTIYERLNQKMVDTLLRQELKNKGIDLDYQYGVKNDGKMIFTSYSLVYDPSLLEKAYSVRLFPNDTQPQSQQLYVHFPEKQNFILTRMWSVFGTSLLMVLMIGGIFYTSMNTIMTQKKISVIKNDFINNMTHEFKTPISTISLAVQVLKDKNVAKDEEKNSRYLTIIQDENRRLGTQVEKVLQMALLDKGNMKLNFETIHIHEIIEQVLQNLSVQIEQKEGIVRLELAADNPEVNGDEVHLTNIIYNLLDNANKYSNEKPQITICTENIGKELKISVIDKGIGMSKEQVSKIFDKFYRVPTGNRHDVKGFGLGLSYVKKMVEWHNGRVEVTSKQGEGTHFSVFLPSEENR